MKLLLSCAEEEPTLYQVLGKYITCEYMGDDFMQDGKTHPELNGKVVAECDYEIEEIETYYNNQIYEGCRVHTINTYNISKLLELSCLSQKQLDDYLGENNGYAIHIKNLHIFDRPLELDRWAVKAPKVVSDIICDSCTNFDFDCKKCEDYWDYYPLENAPKNMRIVYDQLEKYILMSVSSIQMCNILRGKQTIIPRRTVLKEMLK